MHSFEVIEQIVAWLIEIIKLQVSLIATINLLILKNLEAEKHIRAQSPHEDRSCYFYKELLRACIGLKKSTFAILQFTYHMIKCSLQPILDCLFYLL